MTTFAVVAGFAVGFAIGQKTRNAAPSNVKTEYKDGKVLIEADVKNALQQGVYDFLNS